MIAIISTTMPGTEYIAIVGVSVRYGTPERPIRYRVGRCPGSSGATAGTGPTVGAGGTHPRARAAGTPALTGPADPPAT